MVYSTNPHAPKARRQAVNYVIRDGHSIREAATKFGVHRRTIGTWIKKARELELPWNAHIPTLSSAPLRPAHSLAPEIVAAIIAERHRSGRGAYFVHLEVRDQGYSVSLSSVRRTLTRHGLTKPTSKWKRYRPHVERPLPAAPGALVQIDTIHFMRDDGSRFYVYTMIDLYSRATYAEYSIQCNQRASYRFVLRGREYLGIGIAMLQSDNGPEFGRWFHDQLNAKGIPLRHTRVRKSNDNAHIERFNRTIQDECLAPSVREATVPERILWYLIYYNQFRRHSGIDGRTPEEMLPRL